MTGYVYRGTGADVLTPDGPAAPRWMPCAGGHLAFGTTDRDGRGVWACRLCPAYADFGTGQAWRHHP